MRIKVSRVQRDEDVTIGVLTIDGSDFSCFTLEDPVREQAGRPVAEWKIAGETAIPAGAALIALF